MERVIITLIKTFVLSFVFWKLGRLESQIEKILRSFSSDNEREYAAN